MHDKTTQISWIHFLFIEIPHKMIYGTLVHQQIAPKLIMIFIPVILLSILVSFISILVLTVLVMLSLAKNKKRTHLFQKQNSHYRDLIIDYLINDSQSAFTEMEKAKSDFSRKIIIRQLIDLKRDIIGDSADKLRTLFIHLHYDDYVSKKLNSIFWHEKVDNIRILSIMQIEKALSQISKYLDSENPILRMEAQLALVILNRKNPFAFLENLEHTLTEWDQLNIYDITVRNSIKSPDFTLYLKTKNKSVTIFSLKMIGVFKQKEAYEQIKNLVSDPNESISLQAILTLGELGNPDVIASFKEIYLKQKSENKIAIIRNMAKIGGNEAINFLMEKLNDDEFDIQMESSKALYLLHPGNHTHLEKVISETNNENLTTILKHLNDRRIK